jgi:hypothetical protein
LKNHTAPHKQFFFKSRWGKILKNESRKGKNLTFCLTSLNLSIAPVPSYRPRTSSIVSVLAPVPTYQSSSITSQSPSYQLRRISPRPVASYQFIVSVLRISPRPVASYQFIVSVASYQLRRISSSYQLRHISCVVSVHRINSSHQFISSVRSYQFLTPFPSHQFLVNHIRSSITSSSFQSSCVALDLSQVFPAIKMPPSKSSTNQKKRWSVSMYLSLFIGSFILIYPYYLYASVFSYV